MHIVVLVQRLEKFANFVLLRLGEFGKLLRHIPDFTGHHVPAVR